MVGSALRGNEKGGPGTGIMVGSALRADLVCIAPRSQSDRPRSARSADPTFCRDLCTFAQAFGRFARLHFKDCTWCSPPLPAYFPNVQRRPPLTC